MSHLPLLQRKAGLFDIAKGVTHAVNLLIILVTLAGEQNDITRLRRSNRLGDGLRTVGYDGQRLRVFRTAANLFDNLC